MIEINTGIMNKDLNQEIKKLKEEIIKEENKVNKSQQNDASVSITKSLGVIDANLKYLSILINGAPIDKKVEMKVREFLRLHYENVCKLSLPT